MKKCRYDYIIAIGQNCFAPRVLLVNKLRQFSGPLDWLEFFNYSSAIDTLKEKFRNFFDKENLVYFGINTDSYTDVYKNKRKIKFIHDFPVNSKGVEFDELYTKSKEKYERRINRFIEKVRNSKVLLLYVEWIRLYKNNTGITNKTLSADIKELNSIYNSNFDILYIKHNPDLKTDEYKINKRICEINNIPSKGYLGNIDMVNEILSERVALKAHGVVEQRIGIIKRLLNFYRIIV